MQHQDFGRVSMQFSARDEGLSVTMNSADPGFAPAVVAATGSSGASSGANGAGAGNTNSGGNQPDQSASSTGSQGSTANQGSSASSNSGSGSEQAASGGSNRQAAAQARLANPSPTARSGSDATDTSGIFA
jgi:hypothetical protein